ncbi:hypothetical protein [Demequina iriomotensis]|uniref:hypothetical protein n=1 Tax=Demequina iriomotensis TaxID=1536641 RepID=UPI00078054DD|nr:hypothetical protein [Demequina iriomotensis]
MRAWWIGAVAAAVIVAALAVPWVPADAVTTVPVEREWTLADAESGHCAEVAFSATLEGTERRPVIAALPWRAWTDTALVGETVASVHMDPGCDGAGELTAVDAGIVVGDATCGEWDFGAPMMTDSLAEMTRGCDGAAVRFDVGSLDAATGITSHQEVVPPLAIGRAGCVDLLAWATIGSTQGDAALAAGVAGPDPETICLADAG